MTVELVNDGPVTIVLASDGPVTIRSWTVAKCWIVHSPFSPLGEMGATRPFFMTRVRTRERHQPADARARARARDRSCGRAQPARCGGARRRARLPEQVLRLRRPPDRGRPRALRAGDVPARPLPRGLHDRRLLARARPAAAQAGALPGAWSGRQGAGARPTPRSPADASSAASSSRPTTRAITLLSGGEHARDPVRRDRAEQPHRRR